MSTMSKIIGVLVLAIVGLAIVGFVVRALRWLLMAALVVAVIAAVLGGIGSRRET